MKHSINWFEIPVLDYDRAKKFYSTILDYTMEDYPMPGLKMGLLPTEGDPMDVVGGAIIKGEGYLPGNTGAIVYLNAGNDLSEILDRVTTAGGNIALPKTKVNDEVGYIAFFNDTEGNKIGLHSPN